VLFPATSVRASFQARLTLQLSRTPAPRRPTQPARRFHIATGVFPFIASAKIGNGVINAVGQYWWTRALSLARLPPSVRFIISWSAALGFVF